MKVYCTWNYIVTHLLQQLRFVYNDLHEAFTTINLYGEETLMNAQIVLAPLELLFEIQYVILLFLHNNYLQKARERKVASQTQIDPGNFLLCC